MTEASRLAGVGSLLTVGAATFAIAALALRSARRSAELAEYRIEGLRREQARLLALLSEERRTFQEEMRREREQHLLEARQHEERASRERLAARQEQGRLTEELRQERTRHQEARRQARLEREGRERERRARQDTEQRIDRLEQELRALREARRESASPVPAGVLEDLLETRGLSEERPAPKESPTSEDSPTSEGSLPSEAPLSRPAPAPKKPAKAPKNKKPGLGVWHPHPDDPGGGKAPARHARSAAPVEMFRKHYDRYLENYQGYVELAEGLYRMRASGEVPPGPYGEREWEERLRRAEDGMTRTTERLDILEQHNPELATDDRISHRAGIARRHSELEGRG